MAAQTTALTAVIAEVDALGVTDWRDDDWCRDFVYRGGHFMRSDDPEACSPLDAAAQPFNAAAQADFDRIDQALREAHVPIREVYRASLPSDELIFDLRAGSFDRFSYVYDPGYSMPETIEGEWIPTAIDADWYFVWEDWN